MEQNQKDNQILEVLDKLKERIINLEKNSLILEKKISKIDSKKKETFSQLESKNFFIKKNIFEIKSKLKENTIKMNIYSKEIKNIVKKEKLQKIETIIDSIPFTEFLTEKNLKD